MAALIHRRRWARKVRRARTGLTLAELAINGIVIVLVLLVGLGVVVRDKRPTYPGLTIDEAGTLARQLLGRLRTELHGAETGPGALADDGTAFSWWIGPDPGADSPLPCRSEVVFVPSSILVERTTGIDLNHDGDETDVFDVGRIRARSLDGADGAPTRDESLGPELVVQEHDRHGGDLDGDGVADPIFDREADAPRLRVRLFVVGGSVEGLPVLRPVETRVDLGGRPES